MLNLNRPELSTAPYLDCDDFAQRVEEITVRILEEVLDWTTSGQRATGARGIPGSESLGGEGVGNTVAPVSRAPVKSLVGGSEL